jgi:hypothetical protein
MRTLMRFIAGIVALTILSPNYGDVIRCGSLITAQTPDDQNRYYFVSDPLLKPTQAAQSWAADLTLRWGRHRN